MRDEVRVPPDRGGEVRVVRKREREVPLSAGRVHRLLHGAEQLPAQEGRLGPGLDAGEQPGAVGRTERPGGDAQPFAEAGQQVLEGIDPGLVGGRVNPVERRSTRGSQPFGDRLVREQHEVLDEPVGVVSFRVAGIEQVPPGVGSDHGLGQVEVHRAPCGARPGEERGGPSHGPDSRPHRTGAVTGEETRSILIGQPGGAPDHAAGEAGLQQPSVRADPQAHRPDQPVHVREEGADARGQRFGQHRDGALGEIGRSPPARGLLVHRAARGDVVADVRDMDPDLEAPVRELGRLDRVVVVAGVLGIHGENQPAATILAARGFIGGNRRGRGLCLGERRRRELVADRVLREDREQLRPWFVGRDRRRTSPRRRRAARGPDSAGCALRRDLRAPSRPPGAGFRAPTHDPRRRRCVRASPARRPLRRSA